MPYISEWKPTDPMQILVFGEYKAGKSWGAFTFPRPVVMDFDRGIATARNPDFIKKHGYTDGAMKEIFYETFQEKNVNLKGIATKHNAFDDACKYFDEWMKAKGKWDGREVGRDQFDTWIIDSGTTLSEFAQTKAIIVMQSMSLSKTQEKGVQHGLIVPKIQDYGSERSLVEQFIRMVKDSGKNVVLICHEKKLTDDSGTTKSIVPLLTGKSAVTVPLMFDEVYNLRGKVKGPDWVRYLQTVPDAIRNVGSRYGIPNETEWSWDALKKEVDKIHMQQTVEAVVIHESQLGSKA